MRKYVWIAVLTLIVGTVFFSSCRRMEEMVAPVMPDAEKIEPPPEMTELDDPNILTNSLIIAGAQVVNPPLPEPSNSPTAPQIEGSLPEVTASVGGIIQLPFEYSGTNTLGGCIVYIPGVGAYYEIPYSGGLDDLPSAIPVSLSENVSPGTFIEVCYGVYDDQGQTSNFLNTVITAVETEPASAELKDPNNDGGDEWVNLERHAPDTLPSLSSTVIPSSEPAHLATTVIFVNCTETDISTYWLDNDRNEVFYITVAPGQFYKQPSWEGHVWIVKDAAENNIALYIAQDETGRALLMEPGMPAPEPPAETTPEMPQPTAVDFTDPAMHLYFSFDELDGNQVIDHSRYQNHGMLVGNPQLVGGRFGKALEFNGQTDYVEVPHDDSLIVDKTFTIMAWIKTPRSRGTSSSWQGIVAKGNSPRSYSLYTAQSSANTVHSAFVQDLGEDLGKSTFEAIFGESAIEEGAVHWIHLSTGRIEGSVSMPFVLNEWQHVVAQMDENNVHRYWINGEATDWPAWGLDSLQVTTRSGLPGANDTSPVRIGNTMENARHFLGLIDEVRIWRRALSEDEILEHMQQGLHAQ